MDSDGSAEWLDASAELERLREMSLEYGSQIAELKGQYAESLTVA